MGIPERFAKIAQTPPIKNDPSSQNAVKQKTTKQIHVETENKDTDKYRKGKTIFFIFNGIWVLLLVALFIWQPWKRLAKSSFTDSRDGQTYKTVKIGTQTWMAENLNYETISGSWCYDNNNANCNTYGRLYDWNTAKSACPSGWRLPSKNDFETLLSNTGGSGNAYNAYNALKDGGSSRFNALFGGWRFSHGSFHNFGGHGNWWSSSEYDANNSWTLGMASDDQNAYMTNHNGTNGFSVRCLQD